MTDKVFDSIMKVRDSGKSNMLDLKTVQYVAYHMGLYELVTYIEEHPDEYAHFIMTGKEEK